MGKPTEGYFSLDAPDNKASGEKKESTEGIVSLLLPELSLEMKDEELLSLAKDWTKNWQGFYPRIEKKQKRNEEFVLGVKRTGDLEGRENQDPSADNVLFEALETFLPMATRQSPECSIDTDNTTQGDMVGDKVEKMCNYLAQHLKLKLITKDALRNLELYFLGVVKVGWSMINNEISCVSLRPQKLILDPEATIINGKYTGEYIGELRKDKASDLIKRFPKTKDFVTALVKGKMGTKLNYTEWWTDEYLFWTLKDKVLDKIKNPHWNYEQKKSSVDEMGQVNEQTIPPKNHFNSLEKPYIFLSQFNLGKHPWDDTTLVSQNIKLQKMIDKTLDQIDRNVENTNGGSIVNGAHFSKEQAAQVGKALRKGETIITPGLPGESYKREMGIPLPPFVYQMLIDYRRELKSNFGISGSTAASLQQEKTVRGKIVQKQVDVDRLSGISAYIEVFIERVFDWFVQMMYVYYDENHVASIIGPERAKEYITLNANEIVDRKLLVRVKDGSMIPKDAVTKRNEALDLYNMGGMSLVDLLSAWEYPNPKEMAKNALLWKSNPMAMFPELMAPPQMPPGVPPMGGSPMEQQAIPQQAIPQANEPTIPMPNQINY